MKFKREVFFLLLLTNFFSGCIDQSKQSKTKLQLAAEKKFGFVYNGKRKELKLPIIPGNWKILMHEDNEIEYGASLDIYQFKGYVCKSVKYDNNLKIISEIDSYYSGEYKECPALATEKDGFYQLFDLEYSYKKEPVDKYTMTFSCCLTCDSIVNLYKADAYSNSLKNAERVLKVWNIDRLNW